MSHWKCRFNSSRPDCTKQGLEPRYTEFRLDWFLKEKNAKQTTNQFLPKLHSRSQRLQYRVFPCCLGWYPLTLRLSLSYMIYGLSKIELVRFPRSHTMDREPWHRATGNLFDPNQFNSLLLGKHNMFRAHLYPIYISLVKLTFYPFCVALLPFIIDEGIGFPLLSRGAPLPIPTICKVFIEESLKS